jgi:hypothetical protein
VRNEKAAARETSFSSFLAALPQRNAMLQRLASEVRRVANLVQQPWKTKNVSECPLQGHAAALPPPRWSQHHTLTLHSQTTVAQTVKS